MKCSVCGKTTKGSKAPPGWRTFKGLPHCKECKHKNWCVRAVEVPVKKPLNMSWPDFDKSIANMLGHARTLANWAEAKLFSLETPLDPTTRRIEKMPTPNLYQYIRAKNPTEPAYPFRANWNGCMREACSVLRSIESCYQQERLDIVARGTRSLRTHNSVPFPLHNDSWSIRKEGDDYFLSIPLPPLGEQPAQRIEVVLDTKRGFDRQVARLNLLLSGNAEPGEAAIYRKRASTGSHRNTASERGNSQQFPLRTFIKLVGWFPRESFDVTNREEILNVYTDPNAFWVGEINRTLVWIENADHMKSRIERHLVYLDRIKQDAKYERRILRRRCILDMINDNMTHRCQKMKQRLNTFIDQSIASIIGIVERRRVGTVLYTDVCNAYVPSFPWHIFRTRLESRLPQGIAFRHVNASGEAVESDEMSEESVTIAE